MFERHNSCHPERGAPLICHPERGA